MRYFFETPEFGLDRNGLHRLRSRFAFETIAYSQLETAVVKRGKSVQNWGLLLIVGLLCLGIAGLLAYGMLAFLIQGNFGRGFRVQVSAYSAAAPIIPAFIGVNAVWQALKPTDILEVRTKRRRFVLPLDKMKPAGHLPELQFYLDTMLARNNE